MAGFVEADRDGGGGSLLLVLAAGVGAYLYLQSKQTGAPLATTAADALTSLEAWAQGTVAPWFASLVGPAASGTPAPSIAPWTPAVSPGTATLAVGPAASPVYLPPGGGVASTPGPVPVPVAPVPVYVPAGGGVVAAPAPAAPPLPMTTAPPVALAPAAAVVGAAGAALSDLETARLVEGLTFSVVQKGGQVIQALELADLGSVLQVVGVVGLVIDMAFTILGTTSDAQKAFDTALDAIMIACLFIPVYGWAIALVVAVVKMIGDMFGFSQGLTHAQREALERQRYGEELAPMLADLGHAYSPREMVRVLWAWSSGSCGGTHAVAMASDMRDPTTGQYWLFGNAGCYYWAQERGVQYRGQVLDGTPLSLDQQAMWLVQYGPTDFEAEAQVGIREDLKTIFNQQVQARVQQKLPTWQGILAEGGTLDDLDVVADEIRLTPDLNALAAFYQWGTWQAGLSAMLQPLWADYYAAHPTGGSLAGFAREHGYPDLRAWRAALFAPLWPAWQRWHQAMDACADVVDRVTRTGGILQRAVELNPPWTDPNITGAGGGP